MLLLFKRKSQKRVKEIFWHPCDDSAAIMFNEGHDLIFVEKKKKNISSCAKKYIWEGKKWIRFMAKTNTTLLELSWKKTVVKIEMLAIFICNLIIQLTFWEKVLELFRRGKICVSFHKISDYYWQKLYVNWIILCFKNFCR